MKTLSFITVLILAINFCSAQTSSVAVVNTSSESSSVTEAAHNDLAIEQISNHILSNIKYPMFINDYGFEGTAMIQVTVAETGNIKATTIHKSSSSKSLDKAIIKALDNFKNIDTQNRQYKGARTIHIPLRFDIKA